MQAWVSCCGSRTTACDPRALGGDQCGERRGPDLKHSTKQNSGAVPPAPPARPLAPVAGASASSSSAAAARSDDADIRRNVKYCSLTADDERAVLFFASA